MSDKTALKDVFHFDSAGTLERPGPIGRLVRLFSGIVLGWMVYQIATVADVNGLTNPMYWVWVAFALMLAPYVVNIGFGVNWGGWPRIASIVLLAGAALFGWIMQGAPLSEALVWTTNIWLIYVFGHLGLSFLLSSILATPGCEMRAIPHLYGILTRNPSQEHYCPGFIKNVDDWEKSLHGDGGDNASERSSDITVNVGKVMLFYGLPFVAIAIAGNWGSRELVGIVWQLGFAIMGATCLINAARSHRVHCYFLGPLFLLAAVASFVHVNGWIDLGPNAGSVILNGTIVLAIVLYIVSEKIWSKYFGSRPEQQGT